MKSKLKSCLPFGLFLIAPSVFPQSSREPIPVDIPSTLTIRYQAAFPTQCYRVPRPAEGGISATISGPGNWDVCIDTQQCPSDCDNSGRRTVTAESSPRSRFFFVRVVSRTPGTTAALSIIPTTRTAAVNVGGTWTVDFNGQISTTMTLEQSGNRVTGNLETMDGTPGQVTGNLNGDTLTLSRDTGLKTIQHYQVTVKGDTFSGTFRNEGKIRDGGTFTGQRNSNVSGTWAVVFNGQVSTTLKLEQSGETVTGNLVTTDGTSGYVTGNLDGSTLTLSRDTGRKTVQHYQLTVQGDSFSGTYRNEGRIFDNGTFTGSRSSADRERSDRRRSPPQRRAATVAGTWNVSFNDQLKTTMTLEQSGETITGNLVTTDGTSGYVTGRLTGSTLTLSRDTGRKTVQHYEVRVQGDSFSGTFRNEGRIQDGGNFSGSRASLVAGTWKVVFKDQVSTTLTLEQSGQTVTGNLVTMDGTPGQVTGRLVGSTLTLSRNTGLDTIQYFQVTVQDDSFTGTFRNEGRFKDSGTFTGSRP